MGICNNQQFHLQSTFSSIIIGEAHAATPSLRRLVWHCIFFRAIPDMLPFIRTASFSAGLPLLLPPSGLP